MILGGQLPGSAVWRSMHLIRLVIAERELSRRIKFKITVEAHVDLHIMAKCVEALRGSAADSFREIKRLLKSELAFRRSAPRAIGFFGMFICQWSDRVLACQNALRGVRQPLLHSPAVSLGNHTPCRSWSPNLKVGGAEKARQLCARQGCPTPGDSASSRRSTRANESSQE